MKKTIRLSCYVTTGMALALCAVLASMPLSAGQPSFRVVSYMKTFDAPGGMIEGSPGLYYSEAGSSTKAVLSITPQGSKTILTTFPSGQNMLSLLVSGANDRFYSSVELHTNPPSVFSVNAAPGSAKLYSPQSLAPILTQNLPNGTLLGVALSLSSNLWNLVTVDLTGSVTAIYQFSVIGELAVTAIYASDGNYYGFVQGTGGATSYVYRVTPSGSFTKLYTFPNSAFMQFNSVPLLQGSDGNLYGTTPTGGANGTGTIYRLTLTGQYTLLYTFPKDNYSYPAALIEASDGNLYGGTLGNLFAGGYSQLFRITKSGQYTVVYAMKNLTADGACQCSLVQGSDGTIYGTAPYGGLTGAGLYFALDAGLPKPSPTAQHFHPQSGAAGTQVLIWGYNLLSASVQFNEVPATAVSNSGSNYVLATVPAGATTGPITVTTPGGTFTTKTSFTVQ